MIAIRGAITINENTEKEIKKYSIELFSKIVKENFLHLNKINSILFSCTCDITKAYPGKFIREEFGLNRVAIMHFNEMNVENSLNMCIRILIYYDENIQNVKYIYLNDAKNLRKDILNK